MRPDRTPSGNLSRLRVAVIGNSHTVALKRSCGAVEDRLDVRFYIHKPVLPDGYALRAARWYGPAHRTRVTGQQAERLERVNGALEIDLGGIDWVVEVGCDTGLEPLLDLLEAVDIDGLRDSGAATRLSRAAFAAFLDHLVDTIQPVGAAWLKPTGARLVYVSRPLWCEAALGPDSGHPGLARDPQGLATALALLGDRMRARMHARGLPFLPQPAGTVGPTGLTALPFSIAADKVRPASGRATDKDHKHMNAEFGRLIWAELAGLFEADTSSSRPPERPAAEKME